MQSDARQHLGLVLNKLEKSHDEMVKTNGYNKKAEIKKILAELIKEQIHHENNRSATCKTR